MGNSPRVFLNRGNGVFFLKGIKGRCLLSIYIPYIHHLKKHIPFGGSRYLLSISIHYTTTTDISIFLFAEVYLIEYPT